MLDWYKDELIERKKNKPKILIGLGDSFTQGQGACSIELWEKYNWDLGTSSEIDNHDLLKSSYENSWVNKICENYLTDYTPINLGMTGRGNRAAVKELYLHPDLQLEKSNEIIVVFMLTGMERFDFIDKEFFEHVHYSQVNAEALPFADQIFDLSFMAFGLRNVTNQAKALNELCRITKPGGKLCILEFSKPKNTLLSKAYDLYSFHVIPKLGQLFANDSVSYQYLVESIRMHPDQEKLKQMILNKILLRT